MRFLITFLFFSTLSAVDLVEQQLPDGIQRVLDRHHDQSEEIDQSANRELERIRDQLNELEQEYQQANSELAEQTIRQLKRQISSRSPIGEQAIVYKEVLRLNQDDQEARQFFEALGTLDDTLAEVAPVESEVDRTFDLLGTMTDQATPDGVHPRVASITIDVPQRILENDVLLSPNRTYQLLEVPESLRGLLYSSLPHKHSVSQAITVTRRGILYVLLHSNQEVYEEVQQLGFTQTEFEISTTFGDRFGVWKKEVAAGEQLTIPGDGWINPVIISRP